MKLAATFATVSFLASSALGFGTLCGEKVNLEAFPTPGPLKRDLKIVFLGDAGSGPEQKQVLTMAKTWGAEAIIHSGDFEYENDPDLFEKQLNDVLGPNYPYFASIGNHDVLSWRGHADKLQARLERFGANCTGEVGVNMACTYQGLYFVISGVGTRGNDHEEYVDEALSAHPAIWKLVSWHKNQRLMQIGGKFDETGWDIYDTTRIHGAIPITGHEHSYCRSHTMSHFEDQVIVDKNNTINLKPGQSFVFVSGLGGKSIRDWNNNLKSNPWWAAVAASDNGVSDGALFCTFNLGGNERLAECFFEDTAGTIWDRFQIYSHLPATKEELDKAVRIQKEKRDQRRCKKTWAEFPISRAHADAQESQETGVLSCGASVHSFAKASTTALRFENVNIPEHARILQAHLQVYGSHSEEGVKGNFILSGSASPSPLSCTSERASPAFLHQLKARKVTKNRIFWSEEDEDWEAGTVWVSPDLKAILEEVREGKEGREGKVELLVQGEAPMGFYAFDESPCLAPTLAVEYEFC